MTLLNGVKPESVTLEPYPHLVLENALESGLRRELIDGFPSLDVFTGGRDMGENTKIYYPAVKACDDPRVAEVWKSFLQEHLTADFYRQIAQVFGPAIRQELPDLEATFGKPLESFTVGIDGEGSFEQYDVLINALIGIHTPVSTGLKLERRPHVKNVDKFLEGFLYLRPDNDTAPGGDYELFSAKPGGTLRFGKWAQTRRDRLILEKTIPYGKNTLFMVINNPRAIQALTARGPGQHPLMYCNFTVRTPYKLFDLNYTPWGRTHRYLRGYYDRLIT